MASGARIISGTAVWREEQVLRGDVCVPSGATLRVEAGTRVVGRPSEGGCRRELRAFGGRRVLTWPERSYLVVYGRLEVAGSSKRPVEFGGPSWGGILLLRNAWASLRWAELRHAADFSIICLDFSRLSARHCTFEGGEGAVACGRCATARVGSSRVRGALKAGLWAHDDARLRVAGTELRDNEIGLLAEGASRAFTRSARWVSQVRVGAAVGGDAVLRTRGCRWEDNAIGVSSRDRASALLRGDVHDGDAVAVESLQSSSLVALGVRAERSSTAAWAQDRSSLRLEGGRFEDNQVGLRCSRASRAQVRRASFKGHSHAAVFLEEESTAELKENRFVGNGNDVLVRDQSRLLNG